VYRGDRPDEDLYKRVLGKLHAAGRTMSDAFEEWLLYMDGQRDEPPTRPPNPGDGEP
jgi:hypothetical protein